ncbi:MAG TPA: 3-phosphoshikimate 1-carboxyvinyltransferase [Polyangiaceae bacterium]|jgi:3-phosphoshikimate 1-carboxyvinyltransferase|nr:3-phosphoshikimate 1-carboxyvinyltransferase [Polyangiaceae bacterium]
MARLLVRPSKEPLRGSVPVPSDRSVTHRALIVAGLSNGPCELRGFAYGNDNLNTLRALGALGVRHEDDGRGTVRLRGVGLAGLRPAETDIDCGHSETALRLLTGVLVAQPFASRLVGAPRLSRRDASSVIEPLRRRGARISARKDGERLCAPLELAGVEPGTRLGPLEHVLLSANDHTKGALLLSGLFASGTTTLHEQVIARDHTERLLSALGIPIETVGTVLRLHPPADPLSIRGFVFDLPGDIAAASFLLVAAQIVPDSTVSTRRTGLNPTRAAILDIIRLFGGRMGITPGGDSMGEPFGDVNSRGSVLRATPLSGELAQRALDEIPISCALAARARGITEISDVGSLHADEPDRIQALAELLSGFGVAAEARADGLAIEGRPDQPLTACRVASGGDHRIAMTAAVLGLVADGETVIEDADCIAVSFPRFVGTLKALGADLEVVK